jgi:protein farnesyltransferase subunit beta
MIMMSSTTHSTTIVHRPREKQARAKHKAETKSTVLQEVTEFECRPYFVDFASLSGSELDQLRGMGLLQRHPVDEDAPTEADEPPEIRKTTFPFKIALLRTKHIDYVSQLWRRPLKASFVSLDSSQPWMVYWCLHSCDLMSHEPSVAEKTNILDCLIGCWSFQNVNLTTNRRAVLTANPIEEVVGDMTIANTIHEGGGFGGGPSQLPHAATTYAAVLALCILASEASGCSGSATRPGDGAASSAPSVTARARDFLRSIRRPLSVWLASLQQSDGSFRMHEDGEVDVRATYCAAAVASLLRLDWCVDRRSARRFVARCQTYEGGFGGEPFSEAHGGYTFCSLAALVLLLDDEQAEITAHEDLTCLRTLIDVPNLLGWLARRQMEYEGGFQGRPNKLVDGCYSFWQGSAMALASQIVAIESMSPNDSDCLIDRCDFTMNCDQLLFDTAMLERYILLCAQDMKGGLRDKPSKPRDFYHSCYNLSGLSVAQLSGVDYGHNELSVVARTHLLFNIRVERVQQLRSLFAGTNRDP